MLAKDLQILTAVFWLAITNDYDSFKVQIESPILGISEASLMVILICRELGSDWEATRLEALRWIALLLERHRTEVTFLLHALFSRFNDVDIQNCSQPCKPVYAKVTSVVLRS